jgi:hypothetical protein
MTDFHLEIDSLGARDGWMKCWLVLDGKRHQMEATSVFPPFSDVLQFARKIAANSLPHEFIWDEEGHGAKFHALPVDTESSKFHLQINHDGDVVVDADLDRMQVVRGLLESLRGFSLDCPGAESEWEFPHFLVENFERDLEQGFSSGFVSSQISIANFVFGHYGGYGGQTYPAFTIWVNDHYIQYMFMNDIPRFWWMWFELLEKIGRGDFPAEVAFHEEMEDQYDDHKEHFLMPFLNASRCFVAETAPRAELFQMKIEVALEQPELHQTILVGDNLERRQFVGAFVEAFQNFLRTSYPSFLESSENKFDLRVLPIGKLIDTLA